MYMHIDAFAAGSNVYQDPKLVWGPSRDEPGGFTQLREPTPAAGPQRTSATVLSKVSRLSFVEKVW